MPRLLYIAAGVVGLLVLILILALAGVGRKELAPDLASLEFWGIEDDEEVWRKVIDEFRKEYSHITVTYRRFPADSYEETLVNRLAEGKGPDVFVLKNSWVAKHRDKIFPLPAESNPLPSSELKRIFADDPATALLAPKGELLGLPIFIDSLALFYNKDIFDGVGIAQPPATWEAATEISRRLTKTLPSGDISRSGMALGTGKNIAHAFEILSAMFLQRGEAIISQNGRVIELGRSAEEALAFYASFADPSGKNFSWTGRMPPSLDAFATGQVVMAIGFSSDIKRIRAKNPHLNFGISPLPQTGGSQPSRTSASYFFPTVSRLSKNPSPAWQFIFWVSGAGGARVYQAVSGRPPARRDLITAGGKSETEQVFFKQALTARSWPIPDEAPSQRIFVEAIDSVVSRAATPSQALSRLQRQLQLLLP